MPRVRGFVRHDDRKGRLGVFTLRARADGDHGAVAGQAWAKPGASWLINVCLGRGWSICSMVPRLGVATEIRFPCRAAVAFSIHCMGGFD